jgi:hypothetical protein
MAQAVAAGGQQTLRLRTRLADAPRSGAPPTFTPEQICAGGAMTCDKPSESEHPISQWSQREIVDEAIRRGLVPDISQGSVGRFKDLKPHCVRYWLTPDPAFDGQVLRHLCGLQGRGRCR